MGVDGIFAEVHQKPEHAPSDGARMLNFDQARKLIEVCLEAR
jgi:3-deoxy-D-manno-octulosonic acid (KDO) 8-phosphate synthase